MPVFRPPRPTRLPEGTLGELVDEAAHRSADDLRARLQRLWSLLPAIGQSALAAALAYFVAHDLIGHARPFFAPVAAIVTISISYGQRFQRAVEITVGASIGLLVADLIVVLVGSGPFVLALVVALALTAGILLGGGLLAVNQAGISAVLAVTVAAPGHLSFARPIDALVGGAVALLVNHLLFPVEPVRLARRAARPLLDELAAVLRDVATALEKRDRDAALDALDRARRLDGPVARMKDAAEVGAEVASFSPLRRSDRPAIARYARAAEHVDDAVRNTRVLARGSVRAIELDAHVPPETVIGLRELASAVRALAPSLDDPARSARAHEHALTAVGHVAESLEQTGNLSATVLVGQVRSIATDLLRGLGEPAGDAPAEVRAAAEPA